MKMKIFLESMLKRIYKKKTNILYNLCAYLTKLWSLRYLHVLHIQRFCQICKNNKIVI